MSYADVVSQMQAIEARFAQLGLTQSSSTAVNANSAATFASALDSASSTSATTATAATASTDGTVVSPNGATGDDVVQAALDYKGVPYVLGGESKSGIDCSGLVQAALAKVGVDVPRTVTGQKTVGQEVGSLKDAKPGDLIVLNGGDHIAIYMGNDTVIHAPYAGRTVSVQKAWFDDGDIVTIRRIVPATGDTGSTSAMPALGATAATDTSASTSGGLSAETVAKATSMLSTYGADVGLYDSTGSSGGTSLSSLLSSFGLSGSTTSATSAATSSAAQQILAARTALLGGTS
jgi:peptidoglycan DL-endopeptidase CwlO